MKKKGINLIQQPTKKLVWFYLVAWAVGIVCMLVAATDKFQANPFQRNNLMFSVLILTSTITTIQILRNYLRTKNKEADSDRTINS